MYAYSYTHVEGLQNEKAVQLVHVSSCSTLQYGSRVVLQQVCLLLWQPQKKTATRVMTWLIAPFKSSSGWWFGGLEHGFYFPYYMGCHPSHWLIYFRGVRVPPTRYPRFWLFKYLASPWIWIKLQRGPWPSLANVTRNDGQICRTFEGVEFL